MKVQVCLICLGTIDSEGEEEKNAINCEGVPLYTRFFRFVENYLKLSTEQLLSMDKGGNTVFCEKCELAVISPICQLYLNLLTTQLRLAWELGQMEKLVTESQRSTPNELRSMNMKVLSSQLGIDNLEEFRTMLTEKCKLRSFCPL